MTLPLQVLETYKDTESYPLSFNLLSENVI